MTKRNGLIVASFTLRVILAGMLYYGTHYTYRVGYAAGQTESEKEIRRQKHACQERVDTGVVIGCYRAVTMGCGESVPCRQKAEVFCRMQAE